MYKKIPEYEVLETEEKELHGSPVLRDASGAEQPGSNSVGLKRRGRLI